MKKYHLFINGLNFKIKEDDGIHNSGFFTNVYVESESIQAAEEAAIEIIRTDPELSSITVNDSSDSPIIRVEEIKELTDWPSNITFPRTVLSMYDEEN